MLYFNVRKTIIIYFNVCKTIKIYFKNYVFYNICFKNLYFQPEMELHVQFVGLSFNFFFKRLRIFCTYILIIYVQYNRQFPPSLEKTS